MWQYRKKDAVYYMRFQQKKRVLLTRSALTFCALFHHEQLPRDRLRLAILQMR